MANITDQFVTSFSELHINAAKVASDIGDTAVRNFFTGGVSSGALEITLGSTIALTADGTYYVVDTTGTRVYFYVSGSTVTTAEYADIAAIVAVDGVDFHSAQIPLVMEIGTLSNEATVIDTPAFGDKYKGKLRGQLDGGQLDSQLYWAPRNFVQSLLRDLSEEGTALSVGIKWNSDATNNANSEYVVFNSFVSSFSIDTTFDDVAKVSTTFVVDGAEHFADDVTV